MVVEAVQQEGVGAEQLAQGPVPAGQQHRRVVGWTTTQRRRVRHRSSLMAEP